MRGERPEHSSRTIRVPQATIDALFALAGEREASGESITPGARVFREPNGTPLRAANVAQRFRKLADAAGLPDWTLHVARHYVASLLVTDGFSQAEVAWFIGDTVEMVLRVYGHLWPSEHASIGARMAASIAARQAPATK